MIHATEEEILKLKRVDVTYNDGSKMFFTPQNYLTLRGGIIRNLYSRGLCKIRFKK